MKHLPLVLQVGKPDQSGVTANIFLEISMHFLREWQVFLAASFLIIFVDSAIDNLQERLVQARRLLTETHQNYRDIDHCSFHSQPINKRRNISEAAYIMLDQLILQQLLFQGKLVASGFNYRVM